MRVLLLFSLARNRAAVVRRDSCPICGYGIMSGRRAPGLTLRVHFPTRMRLRIRAVPHSWRQELRWDNGRSCYTLLARNELSRVRIHHLLMRERRNAGHVGLSGRNALHGHPLRLLWPNMKGLSLSHKLLL